MKRLVMRHADEPQLSSPRRSITDPHSWRPAGRLPRARQVGDARRVHRRRRAGLERMESRCSVHRRVLGAGPIHHVRPAFHHLRRDPSA